ncbi:MAG: bifunctional DNA-formamidopyrimidine glycosylase/DNA-(apurinic or apyrimidinic site) lyase, partial [Anaerolineaceae bacterium]|nr:bifunctional DNA-formamidopyrimidine glycosylase/DNA-(apurinic or apyrimidinic site) lyase [Anaerolineaceae bacterium]
WSGSLATPDPLTFTNFLPGQKVVSVERRAKFIYLVLSDAFLVFHLRMSGDLYLLPTRADGKEPARNKIHDRLWIDFESGWRLVFNDVRKFGRIWLLNDLNDLFSNLGPEPLDASLTNKKFQAMLQQKSRLLKPLLLDQSFIAGIGNIYSDEALFMAGLHPLRKSDSLTKNEAKRLLEAIRTVLSKGIDQKGASIDWVYRGGDFQNHFQVYQQTGNPCPKCGRPIEKIRVGQRGTHLCTRCQKLS